MRILHLCTSIDPQTGGPANVLAGLAPVQATRGHDVRIITADHPARVGAVIDRLRDMGPQATAHGPPRGPMALGPGVLRATKAALLEGTDILHIHGLWQATPHTGARLARRHGKSYVIQPHGMLDPWSLQQGRVKKRVFLALIGRRDLNCAAALQYTTQTERELVAPMKLRPRPFVIPNGVDWSEFDPLPEPGRFRAAHDIGDRPLIVFLSRLHYKKGLDLLLPAFAQANLGPATTMALIGPGEPNYVKSLKRTAQCLGIADRITFPGMLSGQSRIEALVDADLVVLPSYQENFGIVVIEALAAATPVLISDQVNICREVEGAGVGTVSPCETQALSDRLGELLRHRPSLRARGAAGREWVRRTFRWDAIAAQVDDMYDAIVRDR